MRRPRIGISTSTLNHGSTGAKQPYAATHYNYARHIFQAGGIPLLLPNVPMGDDADEILVTLDALLLSGGGDLDPALWHESPLPALGEVNPIRDQLEFALLRAVLRRDLPVLGICRGVQVMAVATGGDLWQDIPTQCPGCRQHRQTAARREPTHNVQITPNSLPATIFSIYAGDNACMPVNSFHHQATRSCGTLLTVAATSDDGIIEALVAPDARFVLGVQWHPEEMADTDPAQAHLFAAFVQAARGK